MSKYLIDVNLPIKVVILLTISILLLACDRSDNEWEVTYGWNSGWGSSAMYNVSSEGKMELINPYPETENMLCVQKLDSESLSEISAKIDSIPSAIPKETKVTYLDNCADERENYILITSGMSQQGFSYSQKTDCRRTKIPSWLESLNNELEQLKSTIDNCEIKTAQ